MISIWRVALAELSGNSFVFETLHCNKITWFSSNTMKGFNQVIWDASLSNALWETKNFKVMNHPILNFTICVNLPAVAGWTLARLSNAMSLFGIPLSTYIWEWSQKKVAVNYKMCLNWWPCNFCYLLSPLSVRWGSWKILVQIALKNHCFRRWDSEYNDSMRYWILPHNIRGAKHLRFCCMCFVLSTCLAVCLSPTLVTLSGAAIADQDKQIVENRKSRILSSRLVSCQD